VDAIIKNYEEAPISDEERALLDFVVKLTRKPSNRTEKDVELLRKAGWSDGGILDATLVISYFAFVNRVADGLGVSLEPEYRRVGSVGMSQSRAKAEERR
jgi:uncharacterized peroxidase-related enzyme